MLKHNTFAMIIAILLTTVGMPELARADLLVDFEELGDDNNTLPPGFVSLAAGSASGTSSHSFLGVATDLGNGGSVDISVSSAESVRFFDRSSVTSGDGLGDLGRDFAFTGNTNPNGLSITISDLLAGTYTFTGYFHDLNTDQGVVDVFVDTGSGESQVLDDIAYTTGSNVVALGSGNFSFSADGINDVILRIDNPGTFGNGAHVFNGFALQSQSVPEPYTLTMWMFLGTLVVVLTWCRGRDRR